MSLIPSQPRCLGRPVRSMGTATLAADCHDCERRTDIQPGVTYQWMQPPQILAKVLWYPGGCAGYIGPEDDDGVAI